MLIFLLTVYTCRCRYTKITEVGIFRFYSVLNMIWYICRFFFFNSVSIHCLLLVSLMWYELPVYKIKINSREKNRRYYMYVHLRNILHVHVSTLYLPYINTLPVYMYRYVLYMYIYWHFTRKHVSTCTLNVHVHISTLYMYIYRHFTCIHVSTCTLHVSCTLYMYMFTID